MRKVAGILGVLIAAVGVYYYTLPSFVRDDLGRRGLSAFIGETFLLRDVRSDLNEIYRAEEAYFALHGKFVSLDELAESGELHHVDVHGREGFEYLVETSGVHCVVTATYRGAVRPPYPTLRRDSSSHEPTATR